jgi:hypothetical protein
LKQSKQHHCNLFIWRGCLKLIFNIFFNLIFLIF